MQIFRELAGFSFGQADNVRRAMSKKKHAVMERSGNILSTAAQTPATSARVVWQTASRKRLQTKFTMRCPALHPTPSTRVMPPVMLMWRSRQPTLSALPQRVYGCSADQCAGQHRQGHRVFRRMRPAGDQGPAAGYQYLGSGFTAEDSGRIRFGLNAVKMSHPADRALRRGAAGKALYQPVRFLQTDAWRRAEPPHCGKPHQGRCL